MANVSSVARFEMLLWLTFVLAVDVSDAAVRNVCRLRSSRFHSHSNILSVSMFKLPADSSSSSVNRKLKMLLRTLFRDDGCRQTLRTAALDKSIARKCCCGARLVNIAIPNVAVAHVL